MIQQKKTDARYLAFENVFNCGFDLLLQDLGVRSRLDGAQDLQRQQPGVLQVDEFHKLGDEAKGE